MAMDGGGLDRSRGEARPPIPRRLLFGNPERASPRVSPDGRYLSFLAPQDGVLNLWVGPAARPEAARCVTGDRLRGIRDYVWAYTGRHLLYIQDVGGDENWHIYCVDLETGDVRDLTPFEGVAAMISAVSPEDPTRVILSLNDRDPQLHDPVIVDILTGERTRLAENPGLIAMITDPAYRLRLGVAFNPDGSYTYLRFTGTGEEGDAPSGQWTPLFMVPQEDTLTTYFMGFDGTGEGIYLSESRGRDTAGLVHMDLATGETHLLAEDPRADLDGILIEPITRRVLAASFTWDRARHVLLSPDVEPDFKALREVWDGELEILSTTRAGDAWVVAFVPDRGAVRYYLWDRQAQSARFLFPSRSALEGVGLRPMEPVVIFARDGLPLVSYLTRPGPTEGGRDPAPSPMVLLVHGGPWARDSWGYNPNHQLLADRGYAVLSVNYRGSTGFGKAFINAGNREWGRRMHEDLLDAVAWAVEEGVAEAGSIAIMGGSYGGYATLAGLTLTPEVFACGVDIVGPSNLITFMETIPPYWKPMLQQLKDRVGDPDTEEGRALLLDRSPLSHVEKIQRPLLIGQGANDPRIRQSESDQIVSAMEEKGIPVTYVVYPDEGHGFQRPENSLSFQAVTEAFLAEHLGGRFEPVGGDFAGATLEVRAGQGGIPGLEDALGAG